MRGTILPPIQYTFIVWYSVKAPRQLYLLQLLYIVRTHNVQPQFNDNVNSSQ